MIKLIQKFRQAREAKKQELKKSRILRCINNSDIKYEDLIPIGDEEYDRIVATLEEKVNREIGGRRIQPTASCTLWDSRSPGISVGTGFLISSPGVR